MSSTFLKLEADAIDNKHYEVSHWANEFYNKILIDGPDEIFIRQFARRCGCDGMTINFYPADSQ